MAAVFQFHFFVEKYSGAEVCWLFETITEGKYVYDAFGNTKATLHNVSDTQIVPCM